MFTADTEVVNIFSPNMTVSAKTIKTSFTFLVLLHSTGIIP